jgi:DNA-binding MarR family transcriptional regulator
MENSHDRSARGPGVAFLLTQLGTLAAQRFGERVAKIGLTPADAGLLRQVAMSPGISQQELAGRMSVLPSRMVVLVDSLEKRGLVERKPVKEDRRANALHLTSHGRATMTALSKIAAEHERDFCSALDANERTALKKLCDQLAAAHHLTPGVHPGYRDLG